jgi:hypothetical protein
MNEADKFLKSNTFACKVFDAKISKRQCKFQCARVASILQDYRDMNHLSIKSVDKLLSCCECTKYQPPQEKTTHMLSCTIKRYRNTPEGKADKEILTYVEASNWRRLNDS